MSPPAGSAQGAASIQQRADRWLLRPRRQAAARVSLICLPHAGAGASAFARWAALMSPSIEVVCVQPPGRESRSAEAAIPSTVGLARSIAEVAEPVLERPYALFGHSFGAMVAYELARELRGLGHPEPVRLFVSASRGPYQPWEHPSIHHLDDLALAREVERRYGTPVPAEVLESPELRGLFLPPLRADLEAVEAYAHVDGEPLACPISAFAGDSDGMANADTVAGWARATAGGFRLRVIRGGHFFVRSAVADVIGAIERDLFDPAASTGAAP